MDDEPILSNREKGTLVKLALGLIALVVAGPYVAGALAIAFLALVAIVGVVAGLASWFLWYGLPTLAVFVVFVLVLRWLFGPKRHEPSVLDAELVPPPREAASGYDDELEVLRVKVRTDEGAIVRAPRR